MGMVKLYLRYSEVAVKSCGCILVNARSNLTKRAIRHFTASNVRLEFHHYNIVIIIIKKGRKIALFCLRKYTKYGTIFRKVIQEN